MEPAKPAEPPAYYYLQPSAENGEGEEEEDLYDSNGTHITSEYLNDVVAKSMSDRYTIMRGDSSDSVLYKCNECEQTLGNTGHLVAHIVVHTGETPYVCSLCQRSFANSTRLKLHLRVHCITKPHPGLTVTRITKSPQSTAAVPASIDNEPPVPADDEAESRTFRCIECEQIFPKDELYRHMKQHLLEKNIFAQKTYSCDQCHEQFDKLVALQRHQEECHGFIQVSSEVELVPIPPKKRSDAPVAKKKIEENPILSSLLMREPDPPTIPTVVLDTPDDEDEENDVDEVEESVTELEQSQDLEGSSEVEPNELDARAGGGFVISSVATVDQQFLEQLAQMELQARKPGAKDVPLQSSSSSSLTEGTVSPPQPPPDGGSTAALSVQSKPCCSLCGKSFHEAFGLRQHMRIMHAETKPHKCPECKKSFTQEKSMYIHLRVHISNRPFICIVCYKTFARSAALNGHMSSHAHDAITCIECGEQLVNIHNYANHVEARHPNFPGVLEQIRTEKPEFERSRVLRRLLAENIPPPSLARSESAGGHYSKVESM